MTEETQEGVTNEETAGLDEVRESTAAEIIEPLIERLLDEQNGPFACEANQSALDKLTGALADLDNKPKSPLAGLASEQPDA